ncbi:hypothetical protein GVY41_17380 [Frigidibacter albus]|uniref:Uncharacterized protein n=1 Tax=Frigidibacter albus TaxID=1465486 RepID=A0A6L8VJM4_9RHOB|nr:hypothetical protein [Frigidibacter albus]MZQ90568.1 hypothetical protein [Frigidibacter albus]NBE32776.1 hypothetical protein [Frigidibacter albus]GGH60853.1 hypothetical protein GCM10011341_33500 [Frigidibacter albus]
MSAGTRILVAIAGGFTLWALVFTAVYAGHATGCEIGWGLASGPGGIAPLRMVLVLIPLAGLGLTLAGLWLLRRGAGLAPRLATTAQLLTAAAAVATVYNFTFVAILPLCA